MSDERLIPDSSVVHLRSGDKELLFSLEHRRATAVTTLEGTAIAESLRTLADAMKDGHLERPAEEILAERGIEFGLVDEDELEGDELE